MIPLVEDARLCEITLLGQQAQFGHFVLFQCAAASSFSLASKLQPPGPNRFQVPLFRAKAEMTFPSWASGGTMHVPSLLA